MSLLEKIQSVVVISSLGIASLYAQTTATSATQTMGTNPAARNPNAPVPASGMSTHTTSTTMTEHSSSGSMPAVHHKHRGAAGSSKEAIWRDSTRLAALLQDAQTNVNVPAATWTVVANEATTLAGRIDRAAARNSSSRAVSKNLRKHVGEMRSAAMKGDAAGARSHAGMALPYANQLIDWSAPAKM